MPRVNTPQEVFDAMQQHFKPEYTNGMNAVIQFDLSGEEGGQWYATVGDGTLQVDRGTAANPNVTFGAAANDYVAIANGELNPMNAFMQGRVRVKGDMSLVMRMQSLFGRG
jgi:putative sterol carrier protein